MRTPAQVAPRTRIITAVVVAVACLGGYIAGCETTEGFGRDMEKLGDNIEDGASDAKD